MSDILHVHPYSFPSTGHQLSHSLHFHPGSGCPDHLPSPSADECSTWAHAHTWLVTCRCSPASGGAMEEPPGLTGTVAHLDTSSLADILGPTQVKQRRVTGTGVGAVP